MSFTVSRDLYGSKTASGITSETYAVGDADELTIFVRGSPSTTTIQGSNADGRQTDLTNSTDEWSTLTVHQRETGDGSAMVNIEPGWAYLRCQRSETTEVRLHAKMRTR